MNGESTSTSQCNLNRAALLLEHPRRRAVVAALERCPGLCLYELARHVGVHESSLKHHLEALHAEQMLARQRHGGRWLYFPAGLDAASQEAVLRARLTQTPVATEVVGLIAANRPTRLAELKKEVARRTGCSGTTVRRCVNRLVAEGILETAVVAGRRYVQRVPAFDALAVTRDCEVCVEAT